MREMLPAPFGPPAAAKGQQTVDVGDPEGAEVVVAVLVGLEPFAVLMGSDFAEEVVKLRKIVGCHFILYLPR